MGGDGSHPNSRANLKPPWSAENPPKATGAGRKPSSLKKFLKETNLGKKDIELLCKNVLPMNQEQLEKLLTDKKASLMMRIFAKAVMSDLKKGNMDNIFRLIERGFGKATETIDVNSKNQNANTNIDYSDLTDEESKAKFFEIMNEGE